MPIRHDQLGESLTTWNNKNDTSGTPFGHIGKYDGHDDELGSGIIGHLGIVCVHNSSMLKHDIYIVLLAKICQVIEAVGRGQCEFSNFYSPINVGLHGLGTWDMRPRWERGGRRRYICWQIF